MAEQNTHPPAYENPDANRPASTMPTEAQIEHVDHDPYAAWRHRGYSYFSAGWFIAAIGAQMQSVAVGWEVYHRAGHSTLALGLVGGLQAIPVMLLALPAGHLADKYSRKAIVMLTLVGIILCSSGMAVVSYLQQPLWMTFLLLFGSSTARALGRPSRQALLPQLLPLRDFANGITWNSSIFQIACMVGPALGGLVLMKSVPLAYLLDGICSLVFFIFCIGLKLQPRAAAGAAHSRGWQSLLGGLRFVWNTRIILATITLDLFAVLLGGAVYLLPSFATDILHVGEVGFGWLRAAPAVGALLMAVALAHLPPMKKAGRAMLLAVVGFGAATIVFGLSRSFWLSLAMLFLTGVFDNISVVVRHTLVQVLTPDEMRGRVSAVNNVFIGASNELGGLESGLTAAAFGTVPAVVAGGIGTIITVALCAWRWPQLRKFGSLRDAKPPQTAAVATASAQ